MLVVDFVLPCVFEDYGLYWKKTNQKIIIIIKKIKKI